MAKSPSEKKTWGFKDRTIAQQLKELVTAGDTMTQARTRRGGGGGSNAILCQSPSGGIPAASAGTTRPTTFGSATCDKIDPETGDVYNPNQTETIHNLVDVIIPENVIFKAEKIGSRYFVDVASCPPVEPEGPVFPTP